MRGKYDNMKTRVKKEMAAKNTYLKILGPSKNLDLDPINEAMLEIINPKKVLDLQNNDEINNINYSECSNSNTSPMITWNEIKIENVSSSEEEIIGIEQTSGKVQTSSSNIIQEEVIMYKCKIKCVS